MSKRAVLILLSGLLLATPAAAASKHGVGFGLDRATFDSDEFRGDVDFEGFSVYGKVGLSDRWGILIAYRDMDDDEGFSFGAEESYTQVDLQAVHMWMPGATFRPHVKGGLTYVDFEEEIPGVPGLSDDATGFSLGGGFEVGSQRVAFLLDFTLAFVDLVGEDVRLRDLTAGVLFKF